jgi:hypothetical protein
MKFYTRKIFLNFYFKKFSLIFTFKNVFLNFYFKKEILHPEGFP